MAWVRLDDSFDENPKIAGLSDPAFRVYVCSLVYAARNLTDGVVDKSAAKRLLRVVNARSARSSRALVTTELVSAGCWEVRDYGYLIHDFLDYNRSREQVERERDRWRGYKRSAVESAMESLAVPRPPDPSPSISKNSSTVVGQRARRNFDDGLSMDDVHDRASRRISGEPL